ncbi:MAG TPA: 30S ribosomal protein S20 [Candidatus Paceibacterota bacterium]|nr:30S ribosomal protein S20 [Candidatus Paceibacterota bacterium]
MPITTSAKKALRASKRKRVYNTLRKDAMKDGLKEIKKLVVSGKKADVEKMLAEVHQAIDKAAKRGVIKKNAASRKKSRLAKMIKKIS